MPDATDRETVSIEAHQRVTAERDELRSQVDALSATVKDFGYIEKATAWFDGRVDDPRGWAELALPHIRTSDIDTIGTVLDERFGSRIPGPQAPATSTGAAAEVTETAPIETPRPSVAGPNPAAPGEPVSTLPPLVQGSAEWQQILNTKGLAGIREAEEQGRISFTRRR